MSDASGIEEAYRYLSDGGLGETLGFAIMAAQQGTPKVQMDTSHAIALCMLADEALKLRASRRTAAEALRERAMDAQPPTAENPNEDAYQRGRFDGIMEYAAAIRALEIERDAK